MDITAVSQSAVTTGTKHGPVEYSNFENSWFLMHQGKGSFSNIQGESSLIFHSRSSYYFVCQLVQNRPYWGGRGGGGGRNNPHS